MNDSNANATRAYGRQLPGPHPALRSLDRLVGTREKSDPDGTKDGRTTFECMEGGTETLKAWLIDELVLHQVPVLLGAGRPYFRKLPKHIRLRLVEAVPAPGVTHLHYEVER